MGAWGTSLYSNDSASDIRGDYVDKLKRGRTNEEATQELIDENHDIMGDVEEEPLFWFALADTQWNYGRLIPQVREKALYFLLQDKKLARWKESGQKQLVAWEKTLNTLKEKLESPQPIMKKISKYRLYQCKWQLGDVFAYRFNSEYSKKKGFYNQYIVFRKVSEDVWFPGHIIPVVQVYKMIWDNVPSLKDIKKIDLLEQGFFPSVLEKRPNEERVYSISLITTCEKLIPKANIVFLGNQFGDDLVPFRGFDYYNGYTSVGWEGSQFNKKFEYYIIDMYLAWRNIK